MKTFLAVSMALLLLTSMAVAADRDPSVLLQLDRDFNKATSARGVDGWMEYMAPNAVMLYPEPLVGVEQIKTGMGKYFAIPGFHLTWEPTKAEFVGKGPVGYTIGRFEMKTTGDDGKIHVSHGSYLTTWHLQSNGTWKVISDIGSHDPE